MPAKKKTTKQTEKWYGSKKPDNHKIWMDLWLEAYGTETYTLTSTCRAIKLSFNAFLRHRDKCPEFEEAIMHRKHAIADQVEQTATYHAIHGVQKPLSHQGVLTGDVVTEFDFRHTDWMLERLKRDKYHLSRDEIEQGASELADATRQALSQMDLSIGTEDA